MTITAPRSVPRTFSECTRVHTTRPEQITCRECGTHHRAIVCPICKSATPSLVVIRGR